MKYNEAHKVPYFRMGWRRELHGEMCEGIAEESSWYLLDQRGNVYTSGPFKPPVECGDDYDDLTPLFMVGDEYLSIDEIEERLAFGGELQEALEQALDILEPLGYNTTPGEGFLEKS